MPPGPPYFQLIEGQLLMSPSPLTRHQRVVGRLYALLVHFVQTNQLGEVFIAPLDVFLNDLNVYQPDIAFVSSARSGQVTEKGIEGAPDLCIEVLSKSTQRYDTVTKKKIFAQSGLKTYWLLDADAKSVTVFDFSENVEEPADRLFSPEIFRPRNLPGLEIELEQLFSNL